MSFSKQLEYDFWRHPDTLEKILIFTLFITFKNYTFESVGVDRHSLIAQKTPEFIPIHKQYYQYCVCKCKCKQTGDRN